MAIGIGVDTGGTYTDAVVYDFETKTLQAKGKALTTRDNLADGIARALDMLPRECFERASIVSLSTTLATNAVLEDKGGYAKMLLFGLNDDLAAFDAENKTGLKLDAVRQIELYGSADGLQTDMPDWDDVMSKYGDWLSDADAVTGAELYGVFNGAPAEKAFKHIVREKLGLPVVCSNELSSELSVIVRSSTALLNARLTPIVNEFVKSAYDDFRKRGCKAPIMVVRSDGTLMSTDLTGSRPVETILSGPAASVLAGKSFYEKGDYAVLDMGGTTTDIAIVRGGRPVVARSGISLGKWRTSVRGVYVEPFALGGDSAIRLVKGEIKITPRRAVPICVAA